MQGPWTRGPWAFPPCRAHHLPGLPFSRCRVLTLSQAQRGQDLSLPEGQRPCTVSGSSALAGGLGFLVFLFKIITGFFLLLLFFFSVKAPVFAKEVGKLVQLKQGRAFQAGVLVSHFESVLLPSFGGGCCQG